MRTAFVLMLAGLLAACGGGRTAPDRYHLTPTVTEGAACRGDTSLKIHTPNAAPGIDNWRIVVMDGPNHLTYYRGVSWSAASPRMVQYFLADSLERSGRFSTVSGDMDTLPAIYELESDLREFHVDMNGEPRVRIRLVASLVRADGAILKSFTLKREAPIGAAKMEGIVAIFDEQMHSLADELQQRVAGAIPGCR